MDPVVVLLVIGLAFFALLLATGVGAAVYFWRPPQRKKPTEAASEEAWRPHVAALEVRMEGLRAQIAEEADNAKKAAERARYYARESARARHGEYDEDEESEDVRGDDGGTSQAQGLLALRGDVADSPGAHEPEHVARARELGYPWTFLS